MTSNSFARFWQAVTQGDDDAAEAAAALLEPSDEASLLALVPADGDQQWWRVRGLAVCGSELALPEMTAALAGEDPALRAVAVMTGAALCRRLGDAAAELLPELAARLADDDGMVRQAAADGLAQCGDAAVSVLGQFLRTSRHEGGRTRATAALRKIATQRAAAILYPLLNDSNYLVRLYAFEALDEMGLLETMLVTL